MAPKEQPQQVAQGSVRLATGTLLPMSKFNSEVERLIAEAPQGTLDPKWVVRRIRRDIPTKYGRICHVCMRPITMRWNGQPLHQMLMHPNTAGETHGWFHSECWDGYQREKKNKSRRLRYAVNAGVGNLQQAPDDAPPDGGIDNLQQAPDAVPPVGGAAPADLPAHNLPPAPDPAVDDQQIAALPLANPQ